MYRYVTPPRVNVPVRRRDGGAVRHLGNTRERGAGRQDWEVWTRWCTLASVISLLLLSGCTGQQPTTATLGASKASAIEELPVPSVAQLIAPDDNSQGPVARASNYALPSGVSINALDHWYNEHLVQGQPWRGWTPCQHPLHKPNPGTERAWIDKSFILLLATGEVGNGQARVAITEQGGSESMIVSC
jgi:hypothetical protein